MHKHSIVRKMKGVIISVMVVLGMVLFMVEQGQAISCGPVVSSLTPCIPYLTGGGNPAAACCTGVKNLKAMTPTTPDRRTACNCIKVEAGRYQNIRDDAASALPSKCGIQIGVPISKNVNCDSIP